VENIGAGVSGVAISEGNGGFEDDEVKKQRDEIERLTQDRKSLLKRINGMEKKLLRSYKKGGMLAVATQKEQKLVKQQERLSEKQDHFSETSVIFFAE